MMEFLYFPEDKSLYLPAIISLILFVAGAIVTMYLIQRSSKKEEHRTNEIYSNQKKNSSLNENKNEI